MVDVNLASPSDNPFDPTSIRSTPTTDLITLDPPDHFDADFDVVDDMKFIDSLIQTMPTDDKTTNVTSTNDYDVASYPVESATSATSAAAASVSALHHHTYLPCQGTPNNPSIFLENNVSTYVLSNQQRPGPHTAFESPDSKKSTTTPATSNLYSASMSMSMSSGKKSSPQFRWRRRKRRSKAQYPEMSRYLIPIDDGEEVQHLGRTLECTLCGLRGKRCHLTLHFKAKHNEVIDLTRVKNLNSGGTTTTSSNNNSNGNNSGKHNESKKISSSGGSSKQPFHLHHSSSNGSDTKLNHYSNGRVTGADLTRGGADQSKVMMSKPVINPDPASPHFNGKPAAAENIFGSSISVRETSDLTNKPSGNYSRVISPK